MKLVTIIASAAFLLTTTVASASCIGSGSFQTCTDPQSGNSYNIQRHGNITHMQGSNSRTGSSWNQTSHNMGNTTFHNGRAANGNTWNGTSTRIGNTTINSGTDANGNRYNSTCYGPFCN